MKMNKRTCFRAFTVIYIFLIGIVLFWIWFYGFSITKGGDDIRQHYNVLVYLHDWYREIFSNLILKHKISIPMFEFSLGQGSDILTTFSYYGIGDPFYLLTAIVPKEGLEYLFWFLMVVRLYLSGINFLTYSLSHNNDKVAVCLGAVVYCFCGFVLNAAFHQLMFMNAMLYLPLILYGADRLFEKKRGALFAIAVTLSAISNFYFFYMTVLLVILYCVLYFLKKYPLNVKLVLKTVWRFLWWGMLGIMMAGFILLPVAGEMIQSGRLESKVFIPLLYNWRYYIELFSHYFTTERNYSTYLGFSPVTLIAVFVLFIKKNKNYYLKIGFVLLTVFLCIPFVGHIFNGFGYVSNRWTFGYAFLIAYILVKMYPEFLKISDKEMTILFACISVYVLIVLSSSFSRTEWALSALVLALLYVIALNIFRQKKEKFFHLFSFCTVIFGIWLTATYCYSYEEGVDLENSRMILGSTHKMVTENNPTNLMNELTDLSFQRADHYNAITASNQFFMNKISSADFYFSMSNNKIGEFYRDLWCNTPMDYCYSSLDGRTILDAISGTKYFLIRQGEERYLPYGFEECIAEQEIDGAVYRVYENAYTLPIAYAYQSVLDTEIWNDLNAIQKQEMMLRAAVMDNKNDSIAVDKLNLVSTFNKSELTCSEGILIDKGTIIVKEPNSTVTLNFDGKKDAETYFALQNIEYKAFDVNYEGKMTKYQKYKMKIDEKGRTNPTMISIGVSDNLDHHKEIIYFTPECEFYCGMDSFLCNLGYNTTGVESVTLTFPTTGIYTYGNMSVYSQPMESYRNYATELQKHSLRNISVKGNHFFAEINEPEQSYVCIALPYSRGWRAEIDGKEAEIKACNGMYLGLEINKGRHEIHLYYQTPGIKAGCIVSLLGILLFCLVAFSEKRKDWEI